MGHDLETKQQQLRYACVTLFHHLSLAPLTLHNAHLLMCTGLAEDLFNHF